MKAFGDGPRKPGSPRVEYALGFACMVIGGPLAWGAIYAVVGFVRGVIG